LEGQRTRGGRGKQDVLKLKMDRKHADPLGGGGKIERNAYRNVHSKRRGKTPLGGRGAHRSLNTASRIFLKSIVREGATKGKRNKKRYGGPLHTDRRVRAKKGG